MPLIHRIKEGAPLLGTFLKTPHPMIVEALGGSGLDFVILDAEHSPFSINDIDRAVLAGRAVGMPVLVRPAEGPPADVLRILDLGAEGFLVPHIVSADQAAELVRSANYGAGGRGYSATNRAGRYGTVGMKDHIEASRNVVVVPQIEDPEGVERAEEIAATPGISAIFIGRADLASAYGVTDMNAPVVGEAVERVVAACRANKVPVSTFAPDISQARGWFERGIQILAVASEHKPMQDYFSKDAVTAAKG